MRVLFRYKSLLLGFSVLLCVILVLLWLSFVHPPSISTSKTLLIKKGMPLQKVAALLQEEKIIRSKNFFLFLWTLFGKKKIRAGEYEFPPSLFPWKVLTILAEGQVKKNLVTIPEGYTLLQIADLLESLSITEKESFLRKATSLEFIESLGFSWAKETRKKPSLEGYLFPDTYHFVKEMEPEEVIRMMVHRFHKIYGPEMMDRTAQLGMTQREIVILASIIEKETSLLEERPLVSAVLHNRLKRGMPLQSDPTVIYGIKDFDGNLKKIHLETLTPYNTYLHPGLPPTPICNPGKDSLMAALYPAAVPYLYFVSRNDGSHHFSSDLEDHQRAVWKYQKNQAKRSILQK